MGYSRIDQKADSGSLVAEAMNEEEQFPREVEMLMHEHCPIDILPGHLDVWLEEAGKFYSIEGRICYPL